MLLEMRDLQMIWMLEIGIAKINHAVEDYQDDLFDITRKASPRSGGATSKDDYQLVNNKAGSYLE